MWHFLWQPCQSSFPWWRNRICDSTVRNLGHFVDIMLLLIPPCLHWHLAMMVQQRRRDFTCWDLCRRPSTADMHAKQFVVQGMKIPFEKSNFDYLSKSLLFIQDNPQTLLKTIVCILFSHLLTHYGLIYVGLWSSALIFNFAPTKSRLFLQCKCSKTGESKYCNTH